MRRPLLIRRLVLNVSAIVLVLFPGLVVGAEPKNAFRLRLFGAQFASQTPALLADRHYQSAMVSFDAESSPFELDRFGQQSPRRGTIRSSRGLHVPVSPELLPNADSQRIADDLLHTYGRWGEDVDGDGIVGLDETGLIVGLDFSGMTYSVLFDQVHIREERSLRSYELVKQLPFLEGQAGRSQASGWRLDAFDQSWAASVGDEIVGVLPVRSPSHGQGLRTQLARFLDEMRVSSYATLGVRVLEIEDRFHFSGVSSVLERTEVDTVADHDVIGPQLGFGAVAESGIWRFEAVALGLVGYGRVELVQSGVFDGNASAGAYQADDYVAWHGETRLSAGCQLTQGLRLDATWRWYATSDVHSSWAATAWNAPDYGLRPVDARTEQADDWFFGLTYVH